MISLPLRNAQPVEKPVAHPGGALDVVDVWYTIQGEGPFSGEPAVFVRLAGCNLQCPLCDTNYTDGRTLYEVPDLIDAIALLFNKPARFRDEPLVIITGGEPFRQSLREFVAACLMKGYRVQVETNGTLFDDSLGRELYRKITIVCSPKAPTINPRLLPFIAAYKYVLTHGDVSAMDGLPFSVLGNGLKPARPDPEFRGKVYVQPCDEGDDERDRLNTKAAVDSCMMFGYTLCLQTHKIAGVP